MSGRLPGNGRYAKLEREQRWLLTQVPPEVTDERVIVDRYWIGTSLRLRRVEGRDGVQHKLCQKVRLDERDPAMVKITNIYLSEAEFLALSVTPAAVISKSRWTLTSNGLRYAVDEFKGRHAGLVLAEIELGEHEPRVSGPEYAAAEVTHDDVYSGGRHRAPLRWRPRRPQRGRRRVRNTWRTVEHIEYCGALNVEVARFSDVMSKLSLDQDVATCPGWSVLDLAEHLGVIHRWAEELVRLRSPSRIARERSDDVRAAVSPEWISAGGARLVATLLDANPNDEMWAWGLDQHVRFWSRRQLHETLVHRMDLELTAGIVPVADDEIALDAIDEYLSNIATVARHSADLSKLRGRGERLAFRVREPEAHWSITFKEDGFSVAKDDGAFDAELVAAPVELLLTILGRRTVSSGETSVIGDPRLVDFWLTHSAFD